MSTDPTRNEGGEQSKPLRVLGIGGGHVWGRTPSTSSPRARIDIRIVGEDLDDGRLYGAAQAEPFSDEAAGEDQHSGGGHFAQR